MIFFFTLEKGAGTPYRRVPSQKSPAKDLNEVSILVHIIN